MNEELKKALEERDKALLEVNRLNAPIEKKDLAMLELLRICERNLRTGREALSEFKRLNKPK